MARSKSTLVVNVEYRFVSSLIHLFERLPLSAACRFGEAVLKVIMLALPGRRRIARENIRWVFPALDAAGQRCVFDESLANIARGAANLVHVPEWFASGIPSWIEVEGLGYFEAALKRQSGIIAFTAHYGCWELLSARMMKAYPGQVAVVYRALDNPRIDAELIRYRTAAEGQVIERHALLREGVRWLKENKILGILTDQHFADGVQVPFFGRPAATVPIVSMLARRTGAVVLPVHNRWEGDRLRIIWEAPLQLSANPDADEAIREDTSAMNQVMEGWIRRDPGQWLWIHNRWKGQSPV
jgi:Kdo2-lipid IVA lauroyltransferase/acyltransferase